MLEGKILCKSAEKCPKSHHAWHGVTMEDKKK